MNQHGLGSTNREVAGALHDALVDLKVGIKDLAEAIAKTERELVSERHELETAERRGRMAAEIADGETTEIARQFAERHRQRVELLERKLAVQRDELAIAEGEYQVLSDRLREARQGSGPSRISVDTEDPGFLRARLDRQAVEAAAEAQLEILKRKMGKAE
ncbi:MAG: hypothetical protein FJ206_14630 [Gemmatimonadetes bacterium]|nr:hypothetical protein [Gemmatimonadota bacterium]